MDKHSGGRNTDRQHHRCTDLNRVSARLGVGQLRARRSEQHTHAPLVPRNRAERASPGSWARGWGSSRPPAHPPAAPASNATTPLFPSPLGSPPACSRHHLSHLVLGPPAAPPAPGLHPRALLPFRLRSASLGFLAGVLGRGGWEPRVWGGARWRQPGREGGGLPEAPPAPARRSGRTTRLWPRTRTSRPAAPVLSGN